MCGIAGYCGAVNVSQDGTPLLRRIIQAIAHRGPDEHGTYVADGAGLGHMRLSIVGLADGQQPMESASGNLVISYNGEVFNYLQTS